MPWIYAIVGLLVGTIVGVVISRLTTPGYKNQKSVQKELESAKFELEQQRQELVDHFAQSAEMLDTLGKDYTKLYQHLAKTSAELLPNLPEQDNPFDKRTAISLEQRKDEDQFDSEQPKDYANGATGLLKDQEKEIINTPDIITVKAS